MKKNLFLLALAFLCSLHNYAQRTLQVQGDTVLIKNGSTAAELIVENSTKNINGFLYNKGNGRTEFRRAMTKVNDSVYVFGGDTLILKSSVIPVSSNQVLFGTGNGYASSSNFTFNPTAKQSQINGGVLIIPQSNDSINPIMISRLSSGTWGSTNKNIYLNSFKETANAPDVPATFNGGHMVSGLFTSLKNFAAGSYTMTSNMNIQNSASALIAENAFGTRSTSGTYSITATDDGRTPSSALFARTDFVRGLDPQTAIHQFNGRYAGVASAVTIGGPTGSYIDKFMHFFGGVPRRETGTVNFNNIYGYYLTPQNAYATNSWAFYSEGASDKFYFGNLNDSSGIDKVVGVNNGVLKVVSSPVNTTTDNNLSISNGVISTRKAIQVLTDGPTITADASAGFNFNIALSGVGRTVSVSNAQAGQTYTFQIIQDGVGSRTIATWPSNTKWPGGIAPSLSTSPNAVDIVTMFYDGSAFYATHQKDYKLVEPQGSSYWNNIHNATATIDAIKKSSSTSSYDAGAAYRTGWNNWGTMTIDPIAITDKAIIGLFSPGTHSATDYTQWPWYIEIDVVSGLSNCSILVYKSNTLYQTVTNVNLSSNTILLDLRDGYELRVKTANSSGVVTSTISTPIGTVSSYRDWQPGVKLYNVNDEVRLFNISGSSARSY